MDMRYFNYCQGLTMTNRRFHSLFGASPRDPDEKITAFHMDIAASIQKVTEEIMLRTVNTAQQKTGKKNLCLAGGVALNCVGNGRILRESEFENVWIQPASGDAGGALGAALFVWHQLLDNPRIAASTDSQQASLLGPSFSDEEIIDYLDQVEAVYQKIENTDQLCNHIADLLERKMVIGWFQGRMEFGPRALGSRSILGDPRLAEMQRTMNLKIKFRESFRPFAPAVLREKASDFFQISPHQESPYMLLVADIQPDKRLDHRGDTEQLKGFDKLKIARSEIPAVTHVDYSSRVQTVDQKRHPHFYPLLDSFQRRTGCPVLINTSFNVRGEPIVCTPEDAYRCFMATHMDVLVMGNILLLKREQPSKNLISSQQHLNRFELD
jgi:carbamoyltransferase